MNAISRPLAESPADRRDRQLDCFRRAADKAMRAIEIASEQLETAHATGEPGATAAPTLDLARAIRALVLAVNAENRVVAGIAAPRAPASDTRRPLLREALHKAADADPDPKRRAALHRDIDDRVEEILLADPLAEIDLAEHLYTVADELHLALDPATLRDEILGIEATHYPPPGTQQADRSGNADTADPPFA